MPTYTEEWVAARARAAYEHGKATFPVHADRCALLVIDMQEEFLRPGWSPDWTPAGTRMVPRLVELIGTCRTAGVPVLWTMFDDTHHRLDRPGSLAHLPHGDSSWQRPGPARLWADMGYRDDEVLIRKPSYGAFHDTPLDTILRNLGRDTVIVSGLLTNFCCGLTARQAYERGYRVVFGSDVNATDDESRHEAELAVLRKGFALVATAAEITTMIATPASR